MDQTQPPDYDHQSTGAIWLRNGYFKRWSTDQYQLDSGEELDTSRMAAVENSHYWLDIYPRLARNLWFIDYPDHLQPVVLHEVLRKRYNNDWQQLLDHNIGYIKFPGIARKITLDNVQQVFNARWLTNLRAWRKNPMLTALNLIDFVDHDAMTKIVSRVAGLSELREPRRLHDTLDRWISNNEEMCDQLRRVA